MCSYLYVGFFSLHDIVTWEWKVNLYFYRKLLEKARIGDLDLGNVQTARDEEDKWNAEAQKFQPADRETG